MKKEFIAHRREKDGEAQSLKNHLVRTAVYTGQFASKIGLKDAGRVIGLLHDLGKASEEFQNYINSVTGKIDPDADGYVDAKEFKGKIDHSSAGAQLVYNTLSQKGTEGKIAAQLLSLCIASHHSGLIDCLLPSGEDNFTRRISKEKNKTHLDEALSYLGVEEKQIILKTITNNKITNEVIEKIKSLKEENDDLSSVLFKNGLLVRFLFSCLIDADRLNTADFEFPSNSRIRNYGKYVSWEELVHRLDNKIKEFECKQKKNKVDKLRNIISIRCFDFAEKPRGIYQLTVPTGGGKTLASLRFALNHAKHHKMDRVFYIIPFTSIIDQNANEVRKILEDKDEQGKYSDRIVLEHHSNLTPEEETRRQNLLAENWDAPIVFTTQVQFLETLFGSGTRSVRRMHQLANSVIIFDEVQTIPVRCVHMFNVALRFLVNNCNSTAVLCTATQPLLDKIEPIQRALSISKSQKIIQNETELFKKLKRVNIIDKRKKVEGWTEDEVTELAFGELEKTGSVLIIVNKKNSARKLYQKLTENNAGEVFHLSTNMCPAHRLDVLKQVNERLDTKKPVICVSTQLIEAGVDVDFGTVIRYMAGLDSITQAAGRCNRNGIRDIGNVYIVNPEDESLDNLKDIKIGADDAERVLREFLKTPEEFDNDLLSPKAMERFYKYYFYNRSKEMNYPVRAENTQIGREDNLFNLLSTNLLSIQAFQRTHKNNSPSLLLKQSFQSAAKAFYAIDSPTIGVVVPYAVEGNEIINQLCGTDMIEKQYKLLKAAQRYTVNLYPFDFENMISAEKRAIREVQKDTGIYYMDKQYYSNEFGWSKEIISEMENYIIDNRRNDEIRKQS
ncbi:crispr-associated helicase cas3 [hydrocarbon metagenome]|uniref:Crispr-associated helicase cas3 n=1 Tax=hydrocarbon metagenome TaxID=938273 RepID=A0A0W8G1L7_9ZZZZ